MGCDSSRFDEDPREAAPQSKKAGGHMILFRWFRSLITRLGLLRRSMKMVELDGRAEADPEREGPYPTTATDRRKNVYPLF